MEKLKNAKSRMAQLFLHDLLYQLQPTNDLSLIHKIMYFQNSTNNTMDIIYIDTICVNMDRRTLST
jgi:hypothetical protein